MKVTRFWIVLLGLLACTYPVLSQQAEQPATTYNFTVINVSGATLTEAWGINDTGEIVGWYEGTGCTQTACGFTDVKGKITSVECAPYDFTQLFDINNKGEIVGTYGTNDGGTDVGFIYEGASSCTPIFDPLSSMSTYAIGVNDNGVIVGFYTVSGGNDGFLYSTKDVYSTISCAGAVSTRAYGINDSGEIVGDYQDSDLVYHGFLYKSGKCTPINYPNATATYARGINKSGEISGFYGDSQNNAHGFVEQGGIFTTVDYTTSTGTFLTFLYHLNDEGQIAGFYVDSNGANHGLVATPKK
jgi:probable HAF family extracellular repeat protein